MKIASFYDAETGILNGTHFLGSDDAALELNTPQGHAAIEGHHDHLSVRVDIGNPQLVESIDADGAIVSTPVYSVIDYQPPQPDADHEWDAEAKRWQLGSAAAGKQARNAAARQRIAQLEASQHRHVREHCLGIVGAAERLKAIDDEIFSLRSQLQ